MGVLAFVLPLAISLVMWAVTGSPYVLLFALMSPLLALGSRLDARWGAKRAAKKARSRAADAAVAAASDERAVQLAAHAAAWGATPSVFAVLANEAPHVHASTVPLVLGERAGAPVCVGLDEALALVGPAELRAPIVRSLRAQAIDRARRDWTWTEVAEVGALPAGIDCVVECGGGLHATMLRGSSAGAFRPHLLTRAEFDRFAPPAATPAAAQGALAARIGHGPEGDLWLDLAAGPHALVTGTSGSGKSEALRRWIVELARRHPAERLRIIAIDYKGGSTFVGLESLPHLVGVVTDLDDDIDRVVEALSTEVRRRERLLREAGVRDIALSPTLLDRLVVIIDECATLLSGTSNAAALLADVSARGRSLGIHLVLSTQRAIGSIREVVLANCGLRVSLRMLDSSDSVAMLGSPIAAQLNAPGQIVVRDGEGLRRGEVEQINPAELTEMTAVTAPAPARLWPVALPALLTVTEAEHVNAWASGALGLRDDGDVPLWHSWTPISHLRVTGPVGSGKTALLRRLKSVAGTRDTLVLASEPAQAWQQLSMLRESKQPTRVLVDDVDERFRSWEPEYRQAALECLRSLAGSSSVHQLVITTTTAHVFDELVASELRLTRPGFGWLGAQRVRIIWQEGALVAGAAPARSCWPSERCFVVTATPRATAEFFREHGLAATVLDARSLEQRQSLSVAATGAEAWCGDVEGWLASAARSLDESAPWLFLDGRVGDYRMLSKARALPPLLEPGEAWLVGARGTERVRLEPANQSTAQPNRASAGHPTATG